MATRDWIDETLEQHNKYREIHLSPPLEWSEECYQAAKLQADACAEQGKLERGNTSGPSGAHGQNLFESSGDRPEDAIDAWYAEHSNYSFTRPDVTKAPQFTQLVWAGTTHVGLASSDDESFIVANYWPAGNQDDACSHNVQPAVKVERAAELIAGSEVEKIGMHFSTLPPNPIVVKKITPGSWAAEMGVEVGDIIMEVNHVPVTEMTAAMFKQALTERPVTLTLPHAEQQFATVKIQSVFRVLKARKRVAMLKKEIARKQKLLKAGVSTREQLIQVVFALLDFTKDGNLDESEMLNFVRLLELVSGDDEVLELYAELCSAYGWNPAKGLDLEKFTELVNDTSDDWYRSDDQLAQLHEHLTLEASLKPRPGRRGDVGRGYPEIICDLKVAKTGMKLSMPPYALEVKEVTPGTWAYEKGIEVGDTFMQVNGRPVAGMSALDLKHAMQQRPLRIRIAEEHEHLAAMRLQCLLRGRMGRKFAMNMRAKMERREELLREVFDAMDWNRDGFLDKRELLNMVRRMDFSGTDEEWFRVYPVLCSEYDWNEEQGLDIEEFAHLVNDKEDDWYCTNDQLQMVLDKQLSFVAAVRIQRMVRGRRERRQLQVKKHDRKVEAATVKIQSVFRGSQARASTKILRQGLAAKKRAAEEAKQQEVAAVRIQALERGRRARQDFNRKREAILERQRLRQRSELIQKIFEVLDVSKDGKLSAGESFPLILHLGLLDSQKEWAQAFPIVGAQYGWSASVGFDVDEFQKLISNQDDSYYCDDDELAAISSSLESRAAAIQIQSTFRGKKTRKQITEERQKQERELQERKAWNARYSATVKIQAAQRGKAARQSLAHLRGAEKLKKEERTALARELFCMLDSNGDGLLQRREVFRFAYSLDLIDEEEEWNAVFPVLCETYRWADSSVDYPSFLELIDTSNAENLYYCTNEQMTAVLHDLKRHNGAIRVQKYHRGNMARREVAVRRASLEQLKKGELRRQELAAVRIQKVHRGRSARQQIKSKMKVEDAEFSSFDSNDLGIDLDKDTELRKQEEEWEREWAATTIQAAHRSSVVRKQLARAKDQDESAAPPLQRVHWRGKDPRLDLEAVAEQRVQWRGKGPRQEVVAEQDDRARESAALRIQTAQRARKSRQEVARKPAAKNAKDEVATKQDAMYQDHQDRESAALRIQNAQRAKTAKKEVATLREEKARSDQQRESAALRIQSAERAKTARREVAALRNERAQNHQEHEAAVKQNAKSQDHQDRESAALRIQNAQRAKTARKDVATRREEKVTSDQQRESAALRIQSAERAKTASREVAALRIERAQNQEREAAANQDAKSQDRQDRESAALQIQNAQRAKTARKDAATRREEKARSDQQRESAALCIQSAEQAETASKEVALRDQKPQHHQEREECEAAGPHPLDTHEEQERAAIRIQKAERARKARLDVMALREENTQQWAATRIQSAERARLAKRQVGGLRDARARDVSRLREEAERDKESRAATRIQSAHRASIAKREVGRLRDQKAKDQERELAATRIQSVQRSRVANKTVGKLRDKRASVIKSEWAATRIQAARRASVANREVHKLRGEKARDQECGAATRIQSAEGARAANGEVGTLSDEKAREEHRAQVASREVGRMQREQMSEDEQRAWAATRIQSAERARIASREVATLREEKIKVAALQKEREAATERQELLHMVLQMYDADKDGRLNEVESLNFARCLGFPGSRDEWSPVYNDLCEEYGFMENYGVDLQLLEDLTGNVEDPTWYCTNQQLRIALEDQAAIKVQKMFRGRSVKSLTLQEQQHQQEEHRNRIVAEMFRLLDRDGNGLLNAREFFPYARCFEFPGDLDQWRDIFSELATQYEWGATGVDFESFAVLVDDDEDTWHASNDMLEEIFEQLELEVAAVRIQKSQRRRQDVAKQEAAALQIQSAERARRSRKEVAKLRNDRARELQQRPGAPTTVQMGRTQSRQANRRGGKVYKVKGLKQEQVAESSKYQNAEPTGNQGDRDHRPDGRPRWRRTQADILHGYIPSESQQRETQNVVPTDTVAQSVTQAQTGKRVTWRGLSWESETQADLVRRAGVPDAPAPVAQSKPAQAPLVTMQRQQVPGSEPQQDAKAVPKQRQQWRRASQAANRPIVPSEQDKNAQQRPEWRRASKLVNQPQVRARVSIRRDTLQASAEPLVKAPSSLTASAEKGGMNEHRPGMPSGERTLASAAPVVKAPSSLTPSAEKRAMNENRPWMPSGERAVASAEPVAKVPSSLVPSVEKDGMNENRPGIPSGERAVASAEPVVKVSSSLTPPVEKGGMQSGERAVWRRPTVGGQNAAQPPQQSKPAAATPASGVAPVGHGLEASPPLATSAEKAGTNEKQSNVPSGQQERAVWRRLTVGGEGASQPIKQPKPTIATAPVSGEGSGEKGLLVSSRVTPSAENCGRDDTQSGVPSGKQERAVWRRLTVGGESAQQPVPQSAGVGSLASGAESAKQQAQGSRPQITTRPSQFQAPDQSNANMTTLGVPSAAPQVGIAGSQSDVAPSLASPSSFPLRNRQVGPAGEPQQMVTVAPAQEKTRDEDIAQTPSFGVPTSPLQGPQSKVEYPLLTNQQDGTVGRRLRGESPVQGSRPGRPEAPSMGDARQQPPGVPPVHEPLGAHVSRAEVAQQLFGQPSPALQQRRKTLQESLANQRGRVIWRGTVVGPPPSGLPPQTRRGSVEQGGKRLKLRRSRSEGSAQLPGTSPSREIMRSISPALPSPRPQWRQSLLEAPAQGADAIKPSTSLDSPLSRRPAPSAVPATRPSRVMWRARSRSRSPRTGSNTPEPSKSPVDPKAALHGSQLPASGGLSTSKQVAPPAVPQARPSRVTWRRASRSESPPQGRDGEPKSLALARQSLPASQVKGTRPASRSPPGSQPQRVQWRSRSRSPRSRSGGSHSSRSRSPRSRSPAGGVGNRSRSPRSRSPAGGLGLSAAQINDPPFRITWRPYTSDSPRQRMRQTISEQAPPPANAPAATPQTEPKRMQWRRTLAEPGILADGVPSVKEVGTKRAKASDAQVEANNPKAVGTKRGLL